MLDSKHLGLSLKHQCDLLGISRSSVYYKPRPIRPEDLEMMKLIDEQYMKTPVYGTRSMRDYLNRQGYKVNRKRVQRLMRLMGLEAIYPKPKTSKPHPGHRIYPYLLKGLNINRPDMVWATDITFIPLRHGFMYLVAVMDWHSRKVLSWCLSNTLDSEFCVSALES
jgi:putative transposase